MLEYRQELMGTDSAGLQWGQELMCTNCTGLEYWQEVMGTDYVGPGWEKKGGEGRMVYVGSMKI